MAKTHGATPTWVIEPLGRGHDRASFDCGEPALNDFLRTLARQQQEKQDTLDTAGAAAKLVPALANAQAQGSEAQA